MPRTNRRKRPSIRSLLVRRLILALSGTWILALGLIIYGATAEFEESLRSRTIHTAQIILAFVSAQPEPETVAHPEFDPSFEYFEDLDDYLVVVSRNGNLLYSSVAVSPDRLINLPNYGHVELAGQKWSLYTVSDERSGSRVVVGFDETETWKSALQLSGTTAIHFMVATAMIVLAIFLSLRAGLRPLEDFADELSQREAADLSPLETETLPAELDSIAGAMNGHLSRLRILLDQERDFVSNAAHELRTPLTAIQAQVEAFDPSAPAEELANRRESLLKATRRGARLIAQLLDHSRSQSLALSAENLRDVDLTATLQQVVADLVHRADRRGVEVSLEATTTLTVRSEPDLLTIVLSNLVDNAVKYAGRPNQNITGQNEAGPNANGHVRIEATRAGDRMRIVIEDDGPGLTEEEFQNAFRKFVRLGVTEEAGAGLGLTITATLCDRLGIALNRLPVGSLRGLRLELLI